ncbi:MAG: hypothetical protein GPOALKHO_001736 [Sodalis sp.]|nr:MAG: hypothetical protein GPOALKHO_001736 [Sodalis sp.]
MAEKPYAAKTTIPLTALHTRNEPIDSGRLIEKISTYPVVAHMTFP